MGILTGYLTELELAQQLDVKPSTVERWRRRRIGPPWVYKGKTPVTAEDAWRDWLLNGGFKQRRGRGRSP